MCGIAGTFAADPVAPVDPAGAAAMARRLTHRGPDATRIRAIAGGALVSTRLAITDPAGAEQPLTGCSASVICVYNGEIYNYRELRARLAARGHRFHSRGDGEVITHLYEEYGAGLVDHLRGAFAIAIYDAARDELILIRDRMGEKPLVYAVSEETLAFASETRALAAAAEVGEISPGALAAYLLYGFVPEPQTLFAKVMKLPAGHYAVVQRRPGWRVVLHRYWSVPAIAPQGSRESRLVGRERLISAMGETFAEAVSQQTHADVPVAIALSGGIDSTLLAHVGARTLPETRTYSVGFDWMPQDELATAAATAQRLQSKHREIRLGVADYLDLLTEGARGLSEPIADWTMPAYLALTSSCREDGVRVLLTGHGPDELFLAYRWTRQASAGAGPSAVNAYRFNPEYIEAGAFLDDLLAGAARPAPTEALGHCTTHSPRGFRHALRSTLLRGYLRSNGLMQLDSLGLMKAVEVRVPYVDYKFVEAAIAADDADVALEPVPKHHLYAMAPLLDVHHPYVEKRPFFPPLRPLVDPISTLARRVTLSGELVGKSLVSPTAVSRLLDSVRRYEYGLNVMFRLVIVELWLTDIAAPVA